MYHEHEGKLFRLSVRGNVWTLDRCPADNARWSVEVNERHAHMLGQLAKSRIPSFHCCSISGCPSNASGPGVPPQWFNTIVTFGNALAHAKTSAKPS